MDIGSGKNFAILAKLSSQCLLGFRDPSVAQLIYKKGKRGRGGGGIHLHSFLFPPSLPYREPSSARAQVPCPEPLCRALPPHQLPRACSPCPVSHCRSSLLHPCTAEPWASPAPLSAEHSSQSRVPESPLPSLRRRFNPLSVPPLPVPPSESSA